MKKNRERDGWLILSGMMLASPKARRQEILGEIRLPSEELIRNLVSMIRCGNRIETRALIASVIGATEMDGQLDEAILKAITGHTDSSTMKSVSTKLEMMWRSGCTKEEFVHLLGESLKNLGGSDVT